VYALALGPWLSLTRCRFGMVSWGSRGRQQSRAEARESVDLAQLHSERQTCGHARQPVCVSRHVPLWRLRQQLRRLAIDE
jgi:hypothetical protein